MILTFTPTRSNFIKSESTLLHLGLLLSVSQLSHITVLNESSSSFVEQLSLGRKQGLGSFLSLCRDRPIAALLMLVLETFPLLFPFENPSDFWPHMKVTQLITTASFVVPNGAIVSTLNESYSVLPVGE